MDKIHSNKMRKQYSSERRRGHRSRSFWWSWFWFGEKEEIEETDASKNAQDPIQDNRSERNVPILFLKERERAARSQPVMHLYPQHLNCERK